MTQPDRPVFVKQLDGSRYEGLNCTCACGAMAIDRSTLGAKRTNGAAVRLTTGDTTGGTRLAQVDDALNAGWNVNLDVEFALSFETFMDRIKAGQGAILQGWEAVIRDTKWSASPTFGGNHAWFVNDHNGDGFLVYNPLADGRRAGIAKSPYRIPKVVVREWAGKLNIAKVGDPYKPLGIGKVYAAFTRDTEPHVHLHSRASRTTPFPDRTRFAEDNVPVFRDPNSDSKVVDRQDSGVLFVAFQQTQHYLGDHNGTKWVRKRQMNYVGGET